MTFNHNVIMHQKGDFWVCKDRKTKMYLVMVDGVTHALSDSAFPMTADGLSLAKARVDYMAKRAQEKIT